MRVIRVETACEMLAAVEAALPADVFIAVAAVADWRPAEPSGTKIKADKSSFASLRLTENPDILKTISQRDAGRPGLVIAKRLRKGCDWIVANDVSGDVMGGADNAVILITDHGAEHWQRAPKAQISAQLADRIARAL